MATKYEIIQQELDRQNRRIQEIERRLESLESCVSKCINGFTGAHSDMEYGAAIARIEAAVRRLQIAVRR